MADISINAIGSSPAPVAAQTVKQSAVSNTVRQPVSIDRSAEDARKEAEKKTELAAREETAAK